MNKLIVLFLAFVLNLFHVSGQEFSKTDIINDLDFYVDQIVSRHVNPFIFISKEDFLKSADDLKKSSDTMNTFQLMVGLLKINASLKDEHTDVDFNQENFYPLSFYWFEEGIIITKALREDSPLLGSKLQYVNDVPVDSVIEKLKQLSGVSTSSGIKNKILYMLNNPVIMQGLGLTNQNGEIKYTFLKNETENITRTFLPSEKEKSDFASLRPAVLPFSASEKSMYWFKYIPESKILFIQYNRCMDDPKNPFKEFHDSITTSIFTYNPDKLIVDIRYNGGGNSNIFRPLIYTVSNIPELKGKKIYTLIGRKTYSSAVMNAWQMKSIAHSIMIGEETGGKLNHTGEVKSFKLKNTNFTVYYSSKEWNFDKSLPGGILPGIEIKYSLKDFINGIDPALNYVIEN